MNLSTPEGQELLRELDADVLIENFRPGVPEKWGLGPDVLLERNPRLVMLRVTGFGQDGPYKERRAFGTLMEAMSGFAHQTGQEDGPPTLPPFGLADGVAGIAGAYAVLTALYHHDLRDGRGQVIDSRCWSRCWASSGPARPSTTSSASSRDGTATARPTTPRATPPSPATDAGSRSRPAPPRSPRA